MGVYLVRVQGNHDLMSQVLDLAAQAGAGWTREDFIWANIEPQKGVYNQDLLIAYDAMVAEARSRGLKILGIIVYNNPWSSGNEAPSTTQHYQDYANFAAFLANRYRGSIEHWEIWNEPNIEHFWLPAPSPSNYRELLTHAYAAIKNANPDAKVVGCAVEGDDLAYIYQVLFNGGGHQMDILSLHPYPYPNPFEWSQQAFNISILKATTPQMGYNLPIWITETGYTTYTGRDGVSQQRQAQLLVRSYITAQVLGVDVTMWYDFRDDGLDPAEREQNFGLVTNQDASPPLAPKPAFHAFEAMTTALAGSSVQKSYFLGNDQVGVLYLNPDSAQNTFAVWVVDEYETHDNREIQLRLQGQVTGVADMYGRSHGYSHSGDILTTTISGAPIYITGLFSAPGYKENSLAVKPE